jgi:methionyl-tRNA synthetase
LNLEGDKFSTSRNWAVWLHEYLEAYPDKIDELKYVLSAIAPESKDSEFTWKEFQTRVNSELADIYGNFVNRTLVLTQKYYEGFVPSPLVFSSEDQAVFDAIEQAPRRIAELMYAYKIREAQTEMMQIARIGNKYLADQEPWKVIKTDPERVQTILYVALQITANLQIATQIFLPATAQKLGKMLNAENLSWSSIGSSTLLAAGHQIGEAHILFTKIEDELVQSEVEKLQASNQVTSPYPPMKDLINFDDFSKMDLRMGKILEAEKVENADKLLKLKVHTGIDERTIVSGIAAHYAPEDIIGKTVLVLLNLAPRKIRGIESQGMILMAENAEGALSFLASEKDFGEGPTVA